VVDENAEELAEIESRNVGKPLSYPRDEMPVCADNLRFLRRRRADPRGVARLASTMQGYTSMIRREPLGIVGGIAPWNYPLMMRSGSCALRSRRATSRC
jgi:acyl-CoA reductase-like NAD-dependent aldehyde dehydrogenase